MGGTVVGGTVVGGTVVGGTVVGGVPPVVDTVTGAEVGPVPMAVVAETVTRYSVPATRPVISQVVVELEHSAPPGVATAR